MLLNKEQILELIELTRGETVVAPSAAFPYHITRMTHGYHPDPKRAELQSTLSLMLEIAGAVEANAKLPASTGTCPICGSTDVEYRQDRVSGGPIEHCRACDMEREVRRST